MIPAPHKAMLTMPCRPAPMSLRTAKLLLVRNLGLEVKLKAGPYRKFVFGFYLSFQSLKSC